MNNYFRLHPYCIFKHDNEKGCIYNLFSGEMISINKEYLPLIEAAEKNKPVGNEDFYNQLREKNLGDYYNSPIYIDKFVYGYHPITIDILKPSIRLKRVYLNITNDCKLKCIFCNENLNRKTGCKYHKQDNILTINDWKMIIDNIEFLGCKEIYFIGGDPHIDFNTLNRIIQHINRKQIKLIEVITNGSIMNNEIYNFYKKNQIRINLQVISYEVLCKIIGLYKDLSIGATILINKYNENEIDDIVRFLNLNNISYKFDFIYYLPQNQHFSQKYINKMTQYNYRFGTVSPETYSYLSRYNNCFEGQIAIMTNGDVLPCPMMDNCVLGNIRNEPLHNILKETKYTELIHFNKDKIDLCSDCCYRYNCYDCRAIDFNATNKLSSNVFCNIALKKDNNTDKNEKILNGIIELINQKYIFINNQKEKWITYLENYNNIILEAKNELEFFERINILLRSLCDPHTKISIRSLIKSLPNINLMWNNDCLYVCDSFRPYKKDITKGQINKINNISVEELLNSYSQKYDKLNNNQIKALILEDIRCDRIGKSNNMELLVEKNNTQIHYKIDYYNKDDIINNFKHIPKIEDLPIINKNISDKIKYIKISHFGKGIVSSFSRITEKYVIIDIRDNIGGYIDDTIELMEYIVPKNITINDFYVFDGNNYSNIAIKSNGKQIFKNKKVVVIFNENTASCAEYIFAKILSDIMNIATVGNVTSGISGQAEIYTINNDIKLEVTTKKYLDLGYNEITEGIYPKHLIKNEALDVFSGIDNQLEYSTYLCEEEMKNEKAYTINQ